MSIVWSVEGVPRRIRTGFEGLMGQLRGRNRLFAAHGGKGLQEVFEGPFLLFEQRLELSLTERR